MPAARIRRFLTWETLAPVIALALLIFTWGSKPGAAMNALLAAALVGAIMSAVHHAEVIAERVGEPFGSLILAVAVTVIEVGLIVMLMAGGGAGTLARDTVFAAVMITCNLIVGLSISAAVGAASRRRRGATGTAYFNAEGAGGALATVLTVTVLCLVLPSVTTSARGPEFTPAQLLFAGGFSLVAYLLFVVTQTVKHRDFFLPVNHEGEPVDDHDADARPSGRATLASAALLMCALVAVVGLAKVVSPALEAGVSAAGLPHAFVGVLISLVVLAPETLAAYRNAREGRLQISLNLAYGSAMASVGLTIPTLAMLSLVMDLRLELGLTPLHMALLALTAVVSTLTVARGRVVRLHGGIHLIIAAAYVVMSAMP